MRTYCTLVIASNEDSDLWKTMSSRFGIAAPTRFVDNLSAERQERMAKLRHAVPRLANVMPPRYVWSLSSQEHIDSDEVSVHLRWLLSQVSGAGRRFADMSPDANRAYIVCFWEGSGRGGGPVVEPDVMREMVAHGLELRFDNYFVDE